MKQRIRIDVRNMDIINIDRDALHPFGPEPVCRTATRPDSSEVDVRLWDAFQWKDDVLLRCESLDVFGVIANVRYDGTKKVYELKVDDIVYRKSIQEAL